MRRHQLFDQRFDLIRRGGDQFEVLQRERDPARAYRIERSESVLHGIVDEMSQLHLCNVVAPDRETLRRVQRVEPDGVVEAAAGFVFLYFTIKVL